MNYLGFAGKVQSVSISDKFNFDIANWIICGCQIEEIDAKQFLVISNCMGGDLEIIFSGETNFLALDRDHKVLDI